MIEDSGKDAEKEGKNWAEKWWGQQVVMADNSQTILINMYERTSVYEQGLSECPM